MDYYPFVAETRRPDYTPPGGACDSQFHVFGPDSRYPVRPDSAYTMPSATFEAARRLHETLGIERGVIVQSTTYGTDHSALLDALTEAGPNYRGCAVINDDVSDAYLDRLHDAGVRGARFNFLKALNMCPSAETFSRTIDRIAERGWYAKMQPGKAGITEFASYFEHLDMPVVIDHLGRCEFGDAFPGPVARFLLDRLEKGNFWLMLSNGHKQSVSGAPWDDAARVIRTFVDAAPERVIWASDWPHPLSPQPVPNDADLLELLHRSVGDDALMHKILVDNPAQLFGFDSSTGA